MPEVSERKPSKFYPKFEPLAETLERFVSNIKSRNGKPEIETGIKVVDEGLNGLHRGQMTILAARPSIGKTSLACQIAFNVAKAGRKTAFLSLEMTKESIIERIFCQMHQINGFNLMRGITDSEIDNKLNKFVAEFYDHPLVIIDDYCHTEDELYTLVEHLEFRPDVIFLDHIQHIRPLEKKSQWEALTQYFRYLKELAMKYKMAVVVLSQINRQGAEYPSLAHLKGAGSLEEMADHVLLMHRLEESDEPKARNNYSISIEKNRFGPIGSYEVCYIGDYFRFFNSFLDVPRVYHHE